MTQLFDLDSDPWELENLAECDEYAGKLAELRAELRCYGEAWDDVGSKWGRQFWSGYSK
jgi:hypothetical protein